MDVMADTGLEGLDEQFVGRLFVRQVASTNVIPILINRKIDLIYVSRPELVHDKKLKVRHAYYRSLATKHGWDVINNDGTVSEAEGEILARLSRRGLSLF